MRIPASFLWCLAVAVKIFKYRVQICTEFSGFPGRNYRLSDNIYTCARETVFLAFLISHTYTRMAEGMETNPDHVNGSICAFMMHNFLLTLRNKCITIDS